MSITKSDFGAGITKYTIANASGASVSILDLGGIINAINVPNKKGEMRDVVLGYSSGANYTPNPGYLCALIGRVGNRIADGKFTLDGHEYSLFKNEHGVTHLHGGEVGFDRKMWKVTPEGDNALILEYTSPDGEEGYPGELKTRVTYTFDDECALSIHYEAETTRPTPVNLTNHAYFNLAGEGQILDHMIKINASKFTVVDDLCIPTGENRDVAGTPFDLRSFKKIGESIDADDEQIRFGSGYDHNFVLDGSGMREAVVARADGREMTTYTDMPSVQFYAGNFLKSIVPGKRGEIYNRREAFCLETQFAPDSVNHPEFPNSILRPGEKYDFTTVYKFGVY